MKAMLPLCEIGFIVSTPRWTRKIPHIQIFIGTVSAVKSICDPPNLLCMLRYTHESVLSYILSFILWWWINSFAVIY